MAVISTHKIYHPVDYQNLKFFCYKHFKQEPERLCAWGEMVESILNFISGKGLIASKKHSEFNNKKGK